MPEIMDVTLRDGSYLIDFQFTAADTGTLCKALEGAGLRWIEVGHGIGLGASRNPKHTAAESDENYMKAAAGSLKEAAWGMFCIPGIANLDDVRLAADHGMKFVRIGTDVQDVRASEPFIRLAKDRGMYVCANFMKSYASPPDAFGEKAALSESFGTDLVYVVDSAGGMMPDELIAYFEVVHSRCSLKTGFHGHNNLGLSVANAMQAAKCGAKIIDTSLRGMGRSSGNTPTEIFLAVMDRLGHDTGTDILNLMDLSERYIKPLMDHDPCNSVDVVSGYAQFHSSFMGIIREYSSRYQVDPRKLIIQLCKRDRVNAPRALVEAVARELQGGDTELFLSRFRFDQYHGDEQDNE